MHPRVPRFVLLTLLLGAAPPARADLNNEQEQVERDLREFQNAIADAQEWGNRSAKEFEPKPEDCLALIEKGKKLGIGPTEVMKGNPENYLFKRAADKCEEYRKWQLIIQGAVAVREGHASLGVATSMAAGEITGERAKVFGAVGTKCLADLDALGKKGMATDVPVKVDLEPITIADARARYCQALVDWSAKFSVETDKAIAEKEAKIRARYTKFGIGGDRLKVLAEKDGNTWYLVGCDRGVDDPKELKNPKLLFHWTELAQGGWGIRRYQFEGDKLVKDTYREFDRRDSAYGWCK